jgi:hypothetical protein
MTGYRDLPGVHIACTGIAPQCTTQQWLELAEKSGMPRRGHARSSRPHKWVSRHEAHF